MLFKVAADEVLFNCPPTALKLGVAWRRSMRLLLVRRSGLTAPPRQARTAKRALAIALRAACACKLVILRALKSFGSQAVSTKLPTSRLLINKRLVNRMVLLSHD